MKLKSEIVIYEGGEVRVEVRVARENVWLGLHSWLTCSGGTCR
jgi:hypothetical protein